MRLYKRYLFFKDHAGYCVGQRAVGALALARAEMWAEEHDIEFAWEWDDDGDLSDHSYWCNQAKLDEDYYERGNTCDHDILGCRVVWNGETQASLWSIIDPDSNYRRVVEAELALEAKTKADKFIYY